MVVIDLPPHSRITRMEVTSVYLEDDGDGKESIYRAADHGLFEAGRSRSGHQGAVPPRRVQRAHFYKRRSKYGGMQADEACRLKDLEVENGRLKKLLAEAHLDLEATQSGFWGKSLAPQGKRKSIALMLGSHLNL